VRQFAQPGVGCVLTPIEAGSRPCVAPGPPVP
jgi:hypothetical protein